LTSIDFHNMSHETFMREALAEAVVARDAGDYPIGAVLVCDGRVVSRGRNAVMSARSQFEHAEIRALRSCDRELLYTRHDDCVIYTTVEPCVMCLGAVVMLDIRHLVFGMADPLRGGTDMHNNVPYVRAETPMYLGGVLEAECREIATPMLG
jgi:tRNA(adenine34) deaminase